MPQPIGLKQIFTTTFCHGIILLIIHLGHTYLKCIALNILKFYVLMQKIFSLESTCIAYSLNWRNHITLYRALQFADNRLLLRPSSAPSYEPPFRNCNRKLLYLGRNIETATCDTLSMLVHCDVHYR